MTPTPSLPAEDADASLLKRALVSPYGTTYPKALEALDRLTKRVQEAERERDAEAERALDLARLSEEQLARALEAERERDGANAQVIGLIRDCDAAEAREAALREALTYYAERRNYRPAAGHANHDIPLGGWLEIVDSYDGNGAGARARAALATDPGATE